VTACCALQTCAPPTPPSVAFLQPGQTGGEVGLCGGEFFFQRRDAGVLFLHELMDGLHAGEEHAVGIDGGDVFVALAQAEGGGEVLGHGAEVAD
jgi:hypothetical protein